jgi:hypothetical protein
MQDMTFVIKMERPVADLWEALGAAGVNIEASCTYPSLDGRVVRIVVDDAAVDEAGAALAAAGFGALDQHEVLIAEIENTPGALGDLAHRVRDAEVRLTTLYMAMGDRVVIASPDMDRLREVMGQ